MPVHKVLPFSTMRAIERYVRDTGGGLITLGAPHTYGAGGGVSRPLTSAGFPHDELPRQPQLANSEISLAPHLIVAAMVLFALVVLGAALASRYGSTGVAALHEHQPEKSTHDYNAHRMEPLETQQENRTEADEHRSRVVEGDHPDGVRTIEDEGDHGGAQAPKRSLDPD